MTTTTTTREDLINLHVAAGVTKWGEAERAGLIKQAVAMSTRTLELQYGTPAERKGRASDMSRNIAVHCNDHGHS